MRQVFQFNEYFKRLSSEAVPRSHAAVLPTALFQKKTCRAPVAEARLCPPAKGPHSGNQSCETEACEAWLKASSTGYSTPSYS